MTPHETALDLVAAECGAGAKIHSLPEALGLAQIQLQALASELARPGDEQDAEVIMQQLVSMAAVAITAAAVHVLPAIEKEGA